MPSFDQETRRVVVRVVYDGPSTAGKTTNVAQLCSSVGSTRRSEHLRPGEQAGRTLWFDWLQIDGGIVCGFPLRCQLLSVPGQRVLSRRREHLLRSADAVVFVCESSRRGLEQGKRLLATLEELMAERPRGRAPIVLQANKQDLAGALDPLEVARELGLPEGTPLVSAVASQGLGVKETFVLANRAAASLAQRDLLDRGAEALEPAGHEDACRSLLAEVEALEKDLTTSRVGLVMSALRKEGILEAGEAVDEEAGARSAEAAPDPSPAPAAPRPEATRVPPIPHPDAPPGCIWPAITGREVLRRVRQASEDGLSSSQGGAAEGLLLQAGPFSLRTSAGRRYPEADEARNALLRLARNKLLLGPLLPRDTVVSLAFDGQDGAAWLWTITPRVTTLRDLMADAERSRDECRLATALVAYVEAVWRTLEIAVHRGFAPRFEPDCFGLQADGLCYLDDDIDPDRRPTGAARALLARIGEFGSWEKAQEIFAGAVEEQLERAGDGRALFVAELASLPVTGAGQSAARARFLDSAGRS